MSQQRDLTCTDEVVDEGKLYTHPGLLPYIQQYSWEMPS